MSNQNFTQAQIRESVSLFVECGMPISIVARLVEIAAENAMNTLAKNLLFSTTTLFYVIDEMVGLENFIAIHSSDTTAILAPKETLQMAFDILKPTEEFELLELEITI